MTGGELVHKRRYFLTRTSLAPSHCGDNLYHVLPFLKEGSATQQPLQQHDAASSNQPNGHVWSTTNQHWHCTRGVATAARQQ